MRNAAALPAFGAFLPSPPIPSPPKTGLINRKFAPFCILSCKVICYTVIALSKHGNAGIFNCF